MLGGPRMWPQFGTLGAVALVGRIGTDPEGEIANELQTKNF